MFFWEGPQNFQDFSTSRKNFILGIFTASLKGVSFAIGHGCRLLVEHACSNDRKCQILYASQQYYMLNFFSPHIIDH